MDLFEFLQICVGCMYMSDLKFGIYRDKAISVLNSMDKSKFDSKQIADASRYFGIALV